MGQIPGRIGTTKCGLCKMEIGKIKGAREHLITCLNYFNYIDIKKKNGEEYYYKTINENIKLIINGKKRMNYGNTREEIETINLSNEITTKM